MIEATDTTGVNDAQLISPPAAAADLFINRLRSMRRAARQQRQRSQATGGQHAAPIGDNTSDQPDIADATASDTTALLRSVASALAGQGGNDAARIARVGLTIVDTLLRKNRDYAGSVWRSPVLCPALPIESAILCRMSDKISRLANLHGRAQDAAVAESLSDSILDLAGYCVLYLARPEEESTEK